MKLNDTLQARINSLCTEYGSATLQINALKARCKAIELEISSMKSLAPQLEQHEKQLWKHIESIVKKSNEKTQEGI